MHFEIIRINVLILNLNKILKIHDRKFRRRVIPVNTIAMMMEIAENWRNGNQQTAQKNQLRKNQFIIFIYFFM